MSWFCGIRRGKENDGAAAHFAGGDFQTGIMNDQFSKRELRILGFLERQRNALPDGLHEVARKAGGQGGGQDAPRAVHAETTGVQLQQRLG